MKIYIIIISTIQIRFTINLFYVRKVWSSLISLKSELSINKTEFRIICRTLICQFYWSVSCISKVSLNTIRHKNFPVRKTNENCSNETNEKKQFILATIHWTNFDMALIHNKYLLKLREKCRFPQYIFFLCNWFSPAHFYAAPIATITLINWLKLAISFD